MNIFWKVALQGLKGNRTRTLVTIIGVMLSAALFTAVATFGTSLMAYMINSEIAKGGNWHVVFSGVPASEIPEWEEDAEVAETVSYSNLGYALLEGAGEGSAEKPYLFLAGFSDETFEKLPVIMVSGRKPENDSEVLVPAGSIRAKAGVRIGINDKLTLAVGERECEGKILTQCDSYTEAETLTGTEVKTYTVVGTFERPGFEIHSSPGYTLITKSGSGNRTGSSSLYVALENPRRVRDYMDSKTGGGACGVNESLLRFMGVSDNKVLNAFLYTIGGVLVLIIMTGSVFLIYNSFHISIGERVQQYGILMSVGATAKQLRGSVLFEGICIGCIGIPLGIVFGIGCIIPLLPLVSKTFATMVTHGAALKLAVSVPAILASAAVSMVTILISAWLPARKAAAMPIMDCIRRTGEIKTEPKAVRSGKNVWKLYGLEGTLALKNFQRNKKRYRSIVLSLSLSIVLIVVGSAFGISIKKVSSGYLGQEADGDVVFMTQDMTQEEFGGLYDRMKELEDVERSAWQADYFYSAVTEELPEDFLTAYRAAMGEESVGGGQRVTLHTMFIEDAVYCEYVEKLGLPVEEYTGENAKILVCLMDAKEHVTFFTGESKHFTLTATSGERTKEICATFEDDYPMDPSFVIEGDPNYVFIVTAPLSVRAQYAGMGTVDGAERFGALFWTSQPTQVVGQIQSLFAEAEIMADYELYNLSQAFELFRSTGFVIDVFIYVFTAMISLIAVANVFNTISTNIRLRRRELAMLRSVGMSDRGFNRMMRFECAFYGMWTLFFGVPVSSVSAYLIHKAVVSAEKAEQIAFTFPWAAMGVSVVGVFGIVFVTMVYATGKIRRENIIDALRDEME